MQRSWRAVNSLLLVTVTVQFATEGHLIAFTPLLLRDLGLSSDEIAVWSGLLYAVMTGTALPLAPFWGTLAERFTRRNIITRAYYALTAALLVSAWAPDITVVVLGRVLAGMAFGVMGVVVSVQALLVPRRQLGSSIAMVQAANPIAASLGPPIGALLIPTLTLQGLFVADAVVTLAAGLALQFLLPEPVSPRQPGSILSRTGQVLRLVWSLDPIRWNFFCAFMLRGATSVVDSLLPVRAAQLAHEEGHDPAVVIGGILGLYGIVASIATWLCGRVIDRTDELKLYGRVMLLGTVIVAAMAMVPQLSLFALLAVLRGVPVAFSNALLHIHSARVLPRDQATGILSLAPLPRNAGGLTLPLAAAAMAGIFGGVGAALALGAAGYAGSYLAGRRLATITRRIQPDRPDIESGPDG